MILRGKLPIIITSDDSLQATARRFGLKGHASVLQWVNKFGGEFRPSDDEKIVLPDTPEAMQLQIKLLEEILEHKQLENLALRSCLKIVQHNSYG